MLIWYVWKHDNIVQFSNPGAVGQAFWFCTFKSFIVGSDAI